MLQIDTKQRKDYLSESFSQALENMAFMIAEPLESLDPLPEPLTEPQNPIAALMSFNGFAQGQLEIMADHELLCILTANILGTEPDDPQAALRSVDAFKELLNTACGILLPLLAPSPEAEYGISVPQDQTISHSYNWHTFVQSPGTIVLAVESYPLAVRLTFI